MLSLSEDFGIMFFMDDTGAHRGDGMGEETGDGNCSQCEKEVDRQWKRVQFT
jgi:hypothetical protein